MKKLLFLLSVVAVASMSIFATKAPAKPTRDQMAKDMLGLRLNEGYTNGWFPEDWYWVVESGEIKALKILEVVNDTPTEYCVIVKVRLQSGAGAYNAKVKLNYRLTRDNKWKLDYAVSQGVDIVRTNKYNDCLSFRIADDGWGGVNMLQIKNETGIELCCAGYIKTYDEWRKFYITLDPYETSGVGGTFGGGSVSDFRIEFIERP